MKPKILLKYAFLEEGETGTKITDTKYFANLKLSYIKKSISCGKAKQK